MLAFLPFSSTFALSVSSETDRFFERVPAGLVTEERIRATFLRAETISQPELRFALVADLVSLGEFGIPQLEKTIDGGNPEKKRLALFALSRLKKLPPAPRALSGKKDLEFEALSLMVGVRAGHRESLERALGVLSSKAADSYLRLAAALAWAGAADRTAEKTHFDALLSIWKTEENPEIAGALSVALGRQGSEESFSTLLVRLASAKDPAFRAGLWIGLAAAGAQAPTEVALIDLEQLDPILSPAAALALVDLSTPKAQERWAKVYRLADPFLRVAMIEGLSRSADPRIRSVLFEAAQAERDPECRRAALRAALRRHDFPMASSLRKNRAGESLGGSWALVMAILSMEGRPVESSESYGKILRELAEAVSHGQVEFPEGVLCWVGASGLREQESWLRGIEIQGGALGESARVARKYLRGEMDSRAFFEELQRKAAGAQLLPGVALQRTQTLYAQALLGAGTRYFDAKKVPYPGGLAKAEKRKPRPVAADSSFFEDLWHWLESDWLLR